MSHTKNASVSLAAALSAALFAPAFAAGPAPTSMGAAPVTATPQPEALGDAAFLTRAPRVSASAAATAHGERRTIELAAPGPAALADFKAENLAARNRLKALKIGFGRAVARPRIDLGALDWQAQPDGSQAARFTVASTGANALRARLLLQPRGVDPDAIGLRFAGADGRVFAARGGAFASGRSGWSPVVSGEAITIEIQLPKGVGPDSVRLDAPALSHLVFDPLTDRDDIAKARADIGTSGACEQDVACRVNPSPGFVSASKAVAHLAITSARGETGWCTGTLLNNGHSPKRALLWTAAHCVDDQRMADSFVTYWFFDATACNSRRASAQTTVLSGGSSLLYRDTTTDVSLLQLKATPPAGAFYAGWNRDPLASGTLAEAIHHPSGDLKKYSLAQVGTASTQATISGVQRRPVTQAKWTGSGVTEGGSSGSGLFTVNAAGEYQLRGGLVGGPSHCGAAPAQKYDYYSQLSNAWPRVSAFFSP